MENLIEKRVLEVVSRISGRKISAINPEGNLKNELCLDSIQIVELFAALENEFEVEFPLQMMTSRTGREFMDMLQKTLQDNFIQVRV